MRNTAEGAETEARTEGKPEIEREQLDVRGELVGADLVLGLDLAPLL